MIKAVFFDVDGTLVSHRTKGIPDSARRSLEELKRKGVSIFLSTGRHRLELEQMPVREIAFDGYITLNGQLGLDERLERIFDEPFDRELTEGILSVFRGKQFPMVLVEEDRIYINDVNEAVRQAQRAVSTPVPPVGEYKNSPIYQATVFFREEEEKVLKEQLPENCRLARWCPWGVDVIARMGGKTAGMKKFMNRLGLQASEVMAFGDAENDIDMLGFAGIDVAMGNAGERVKLAADYVTSDIDEDGIERGLRYFGVI